MKDREERKVVEKRAAVYVPQRSNCTAVQLYCCAAVRTRRFRVFLYSIRSNFDIVQLYFCQVVLLFFFSSFQLPLFRVEVLVLILRSRKEKNFLKVE